MNNGILGDKIIEEIKQIVIETQQEITKEEFSKIINTLDSIIDKRIAQRVNIHKKILTQKFIEMLIELLEKFGGNDAETPWY